MTKIRSDNLTDDDTFLDKSPLEKIYEEMGIKGLEQKNYNNYQIVGPKSSSTSFQVYQPKSSAEYYHTMHSTPNPNTAPANYRVIFFLFVEIINLFLMYS